MYCKQHDQIMEFRDKQFICAKCDAERGARFRGMFELMTTGAPAAIQGPRAANDTPSLQEQMGVDPVGPVGWFLSLNSVNDLQRATISKTIDHAKRARWVNAIVRKDSAETRYEADWIKHMVEVIPQSGVVADMTMWRGRARRAEEALTELLDAARALNDSNNTVMVDYHAVLKATNALDELKKSPL